MESIWSFCKEHAGLLFLPAYMILLWRSIHKQETRPKDKANLVGVLCIFCSGLLIIPASYLYISVTAFVLDISHRVSTTLCGFIGFILVGSFLFLFIPIFMFSTTRFIGKFFVYKNYITQEQYEETFFSKKRTQKQKAE